MPFFILFPVFFYFCFLLFIIYGTSKIELNKKKINNSFDPISIIVCVRNGEKSIINLLNNLKRQIYQGKLEFIIIDDNSTDNTKEKILSFIKLDSRFKYFSTYQYNKKLNYKKKALHLGIEKAQYNWLLFTDVDCNFKEKWALSMSQYFIDCDYLIGFSRVVSTNTIISKFQSIDFQMLMLSACSSSTLNFPLACTGQNQAYKKSIFKEVGGFSKIKNLLQGDDTIFLQLCKKNKKNKINFSTYKESFITAKTHRNWVDFLKQRIRWAGDANIMWKYNKLFFAIILSTFITNLLIPLFFLFIVIEKNLLMFLISLIFIKLLLELILYIKGSNRLNLDVSYSSFLLWYIVQPFYVIIVGLGSYFVQYFNWKGRKAV